MKIAFFGTGDFSRQILEGILKSNKLDIKLVVSQIDKPVGRKKEILETPVKKFALENNLPVLQIEKLKDNIDFINILKGLELDFIVVVAYGKIMPEIILKIPKYCSINIHGSILPKYRGASPIQESIKNGDLETGLTIMQMSAGMDEGDIFAIKKINIEENDKSKDIFKKFGEIGTDLLIDTLYKISSNLIKGEKQNDLQATYCSKIIKENGLINFKEENIKDIYNKFRAYYDWPGIYSYYNGKKIDFLEIDFIESELVFDDDFSLGDVVEYENNGINNIGILCSGGILILNKVKIEGKKEMDIFTFLNGNKTFLEYNFAN